MVTDRSSSGWPSAARRRFPAPGHGLLEAGKDEVDVDAGVDAGVVDALVLGGVDEVAAEVDPLVLGASGLDPPLLESTVPELVDRVPVVDPLGTAPETEAPELGDVVLPGLGGAYLLTMPMICRS
jgi:hypothetical protein